MYSLSILWYAFGLVPVHSTDKHEYIGFPTIKGSPRQWNFHSKMGILFSACMASLLVYIGI